MRRTRPTRRLAPWHTLIVAALIAPVAAVGLIASPASAGVITSHVVINEIVADPTTGDAWVELYNPTSGTVSVCGIEDDDGNAVTSCGNMTGDFLTYAIDPDFLDDGGDTISLRGSVIGEILDTVTYPALGPGQSYARTFDGSTEWEVRPPAGVTRNTSNGAVPADSTPPVLTVSNPVDGGTYPGGFTAGYSASDDVAGVLRVAFYLRDGASSDPYVWKGTDVNTANQEPFISIEDFGVLAPGTYDVCVTARDRLGNGAPATTDPIASCDDASPAVVAVNDIVVTGPVTPPADPVVTLTSPADGTVTDNGTPGLTWTTTIDPGFTVIGRQLVLSTSADFTASPVSYTPAADAFTLPDPFGAAADATWYWKIVLTFARTPIAPSETVESAAWTFTVDRAGPPVPGPADPPDPPVTTTAVATVTTVPVVSPGSDGPAGPAGLVDSPDPAAAVSPADPPGPVDPSRTAPDHRVLASTGIAGVHTWLLIGVLLLAAGAPMAVRQRSSDVD